MDRIEVSVSSPRGGRVEGFKYWWAKYVTGFNQALHCGGCLRGTYSQRWKRGMSLGSYVFDEVDRFDYVYLCGVRAAAYAKGSILPVGYDDNFHLALRPSREWNATAKTYNGVTIVARGAEMIPIRALPEHWSGLPLAMTSCRNFQFGAQAYGYDPAGAPPRAHT